MSDPAIPYVYEPWTDPIFRACLQRQDGAFLDVGANIGQTLQKVHLLLRGPYVGFEPQLEGAAQVERQLRGMPTVSGTILPLALADFSGPVRLQRRQCGPNDPVPASASIVDGFRSHEFYSDEVWAVAAMGDDIVPGIIASCPVSTVKIDAEGAELEVVRGLNRTLTRHRPAVLFEVLNHFLIVGRRALDETTISFREARLAELELQLRGLGYEIGRILASGMITLVDRIRPLRERHQRETMYVALQPRHLASFPVLSSRWPRRARHRAGASRVAPS